VAYREAKLNAFRRQGPDALAVVPDGLGVELPGSARRVTFGPGGDMGLDGDTLTWRDEPLIDAGEIRIRGPHNRDNAMAAAAVALARGIAPEAVREALRT